MLTFPIGQTARVPVVLTDASNGSALNGITWSSVSVTVIKADGTMVDLTITISDWEPKTQGAYVNKGYYNVILPASVLDQEGVLQYGVAAPSAEFYPGVIHLRGNTEKQIYDRLGAPVDTSISADIQNIAATQGGEASFTATDRSNLLAIKGKTDLLPNDPASQAAVDAKIEQSFWTTDRSNLQAIKNKTDLIGTATVASQSDVNAVRGANLGGSVQLVDLAEIYTLVNGVKTKTDLLPSDPASNSYLGGTGYDPATDSLHQLQLAQAGAGEGGFGPTDRADLQAVKAKTDNLPVDPVSYTQLTAAKREIMGSDVNGNGGNDIQDVYNRIITNVEPRTNMIPQTSGNVLTTQVFDQIKGPNWASPDDTLSGIRDAIGFGQFNETDRAMLTQARDNSAATNTKATSIQSKTDNLPSDPASNSYINSVLGGGTYVFTPDDHDMLVAINNKTQNLPLDPASATTSFNDVDRAVLAAVRTKTDLLPPDPAAGTSVTALSNKIGTPRTTIAGDIGEIEDLLVSE